MTHIHTSSHAPPPRRSACERLGEDETLPFMSNDALLRAALLFDGAPSSGFPDLLKPHAVVQAERLVRLKLAGRAAPALDMPPIPSWEYDRFGSEARQEALHVENTPTRPAPSLRSLSVTGFAESGHLSGGANVAKPDAQDHRGRNARRMWPLLIVVAVAFQAGTLVVGQAVYASEISPAAAGEVRLVASARVLNSAVDRPSVEDDEAPSKKVEPRTGETARDARPVTAKITPVVSPIAVARPARVKAQWPKKGQASSVRTRRPLSLYPLDI